MKNIAKRITLFLMILLVLSVNVICSYAVTNENTTQIQTATNQTTKIPPDIDVKLGLNEVVKVGVEDNTIIIHNQSVKKITGIKSYIKIGDKKLKVRYRGKINGFEKYIISLEDYYSADFLEGKQISVKIDDCMTNSGWAIYVISWIVALLFFSRIYSSDFADAVGVGIVLTIIWLFVGAMFGF